MTKILSDPLVPPECDLRDFPFMPLEVMRLRDSDLAAIQDAEIFRTDVLSWCVAWHQLPAASLPNDDSVLARLLGYGRDVETWKRLRAAGALRGFIECSDGRLYHPVVAEKAKESWSKKVGYRNFRALQVEKGKKGAAKRWSLPDAHGHAAEHSHGHGTGDSQWDGSGLCPNDGLKGQYKGQYKGEGEGSARASLSSTRRSVRSYPDDFEAFWCEFPKQPNSSKVDALKAWKAVEGDRPPLDDLLRCVRAYSALLDNQRRREKRDPLVCHAATWLRGQRWEGFAAEASSAARGANGVQIDVAATLAAWNGAASGLIDVIGAANFKAWFVGSKLEPGPPKRIVVDGSYARDEIDKRFSAQLRSVFGNDIVVVVADVRMAA